MKNIISPPKSQAAKLQILQYNENLKPQKLREYYGGQVCLPSQRARHSSESSNPTDQFLFRAEDACKMGYEGGIRNIQLLISYPLGGMQYCTSIPQIGIQVLKFRDEINTVTYFVPKTSLALPQMEESGPLGRTRQLGRTGQLGRTRPPGQPGKPPSLGGPGRLGCLGGPVRLGCLGCPGCPGRPGPSHPLLRRYQPLRLFMLHIF